MKFFKCLNYFSKKKIFWWKRNLIFFCFVYAKICNKFLSIKTDAIYFALGGRRMEAEAGKAVISEARSVWREAKRYRRLDRANNDSTIPNGVYISVFGGLRRSYQASAKRKGAGEGKKRGTRICFHWHTRAELGSFRKNLFSRANYVPARHEASLFLSLSLSLSSTHIHRVFCLLCIASWSATDDCLHCDEALEQTITIITFPSSMTAWHIKWKSSYRDERSFFP